jgi:hypothetical protein
MNFPTVTPILFILVFYILCNVQFVDWVVGKLVPQASPTR